LKCSLSSLRGGAQLSGMVVAVFPRVLALRFGNPNPDSAVADRVWISPIFNWAGTTLALSGSGGTVPPALPTLANAYTTASNFWSF